ncbi:MAG: SurA N-terminal domain-containing protein [Deltaproteobacteria bacterium]|jgi:peptidyl-prolyl cis-trans isomerase D|nr:SurA N-terminal domain-containing protein [Deltaproteobacteria bacterium]
MLDFIRTRSGGIISILIVGAIALVFVFWGIGGQNTSDSLTIRLDDESVPVTEYAEIKGNIRESLLRENPGAAPDILEMVSGQRAVSTLIQRHVLSKLAKDTGRVIPDTALAAAIRSDPSFSENGRFSKERYELVVRNFMGQNVQSFENALRNDLLINETINFLQNLTFVPTASLLQEFHLGEDLISLKYAFFPTSAQTAGPEPTDSELEAFYAENGENWRKPAEVRVEYVSFNPDDHLAEVSVTGEEIETLYSEELESLTSPAEARLSNILVAFPNFEPSDEQKRETLEKALAILARTATEDFGTLATEVSDDANTSRGGGDMGILRKDDPLPEIDALVFGADPPPAPGTILGPVDTLFGYQLVRVDSFIPGRPQTLAEARPNLLETLRKRNARRLAVNRLEDLLESMQNSQSSNLREHAATMGLETRTSDFFGVDNPPDFFGGNRAEVERAVSQPLGLISDPVDTPGLLTLFVPLEKKESFVPPLTDEDVRESVKVAWIASEAFKKTESLARELVETASDIPFSEAAEKFSDRGITLGVTTDFPRVQVFFTDQEPLVFADRGELINSLFKLTEAGMVAPEPLRIDAGAFKGHLVISLNEFARADENNFRLSEGSRRDNALDSRANESFSLWIEAVARKVDLRLPPELMTELYGSPARANP